MEGQKGGPLSKERFLGRQAFLPRRPAAADPQRRRPAAADQTSAAEVSRPPLLGLLSLFVSGDFAPDLLPATMEDKIAKSPSCVSKKDPPSLPSLSEAPLSLIHI